MRLRDGYVIRDGRLWKRTVLPTAGTPRWLKNKEKREAAKLPPEIARAKAI